MMKRRIAITAALLATIAGLGSGAAASASTAPAIQTYDCGAKAITVYWNNGGATQYCGSVGSAHVGFTAARGLYSGQYWGFVTCSNGAQKYFSPGATMSVYCDVTWIGITPPNWN
jgi:hypothetical protein